MQNVTLCCLHIGLVKILEALAEIKIELQITV